MMREASGIHSEMRSEIHSEAYGEMRARFVMMAAACLLPCGLAFAQVSPASPSAGLASKRVCVDVEVGGERTLSYDCLSQQLTPTTPPDAPASQSAAQALANGPSNRVGTFNLSAERNRFGANWGKSITPQRPQPLPAVPVGR
ncbi:hypothetical protein PQR67_12195 [Paraburkholderia fungorum]|uniref:hypothetical protein n=1 Tax=Paraburkholderia fungorum TaxID=134537 RepID=UPI0038B7F583